MGADWTAPKHGRVSLGVAKTQSELLVIGHVKCTGPQAKLWVAPWVHPCRSTEKPFSYEAAGQNGEKSRLLCFFGLSFGPSLCQSSRASGSASQLLNQTLYYTGWPTKLRNLPFHSYLKDTHLSESFSPRDFQ